MRSRGSSRGLIAAFLIAAPVLVGVLYCVVGALGLLDQGAGGAAWGVLTERGTWSSVAWSLWAATASTLVAFVAAIAVASLFRSSKRIDRMARGLAVVPLPIPHLVAGFVGLLVLGQSGLVSRLAFSLGIIAQPAEMPILVYDSFGLGFILTTAAKEIPFLALVALSLLGTDLRLLEESARTLGATPGDLFRRVTLPLLYRGMLPATVAVFTFVFGSYEVAAILGPTTPAPLPVLISERHTGAVLAQRADAYLLSLLALLIASGAVAIHEIVRRGAWNEHRA